MAASSDSALRFSASSSAAAFFCSASSSGRGAAFLRFEFGRGAALFGVERGGGLTADGREFGFVRFRRGVRLCLRRLPGEFEFALCGVFELFERGLRANPVGDRLVERGGAGFEFGDAGGVGARSRPHPQEEDQRAEDETGDASDDSV